MKRNWSYTKSLNIIAVLFCVMSAKAQNTDFSLKYEDLLPTFSTMTPEAEAFERYGSVGISEYSGTPNISIPLYTVSAGDIVIPITLNYDASGIKVDQEATCVGLGWNLMYGGQITHIQCGRPDYEHSIYSESTIRDYLNQQFYSHLSSFEAPSVKTVTQLGQTSVDYIPEESKLTAIKLGYHTPDIYQASFCGHSVSFVINADSAIVIGDDATKYKIIFEMGLVPLSITIIDDQGISYNFSAYAEEAAAVKDSYYLESIIGPEGENSRSKVRFSYISSGSYRKQFYFQSVGKKIQGEIYPEEIERGYLDKKGSIEDGGYINGKIFPFSIETDREIIRFEYGQRTDIPQFKRIDKIVVRSKNLQNCSSSDSIIHNIQFRYNYFQESGRNEEFSRVQPYSNCRLKLEGVTIDDDKNYSLYYNATSLPYKNSLSVDYWGYYNGIRNEDLVAVPDYRFECGILAENIHVDLANRYCSPEVCKAGILEKIVYPTGGYTQFDYEANHFDDPNGYYMDARYASDNCTGTVSCANVGTASYSYYYNEANSLVEQNFSLAHDQRVQVTLGGHAANASNSYAELNLWRIVGTTKNQFIHKRISRNENLSLTIDTLLTAGEYQVSVYIPQIHDTNYITSGGIGVSYSEIRTQPLHPCGDASGQSIGGGLRIRQIRNYNESADLQQIISYSYEGGKLLIPTVLPEYKEDWYCYSPSGTVPQARIAKFYFIGSQTPHYSICSFGSPTVGYSSVTARYTDGAGQVLKKTISNYHNTPYTLVSPKIFYHTNNGMNGKIQQSEIFSGESNLMSRTQYEYQTCRYPSVWYPYCEPLFIFDPNNHVTHDYQLSFYPKAKIWSYLARTVEQQFVAGSPMESIITSYSYNEGNFRPSVISRTCGNLVSTTRSYYPSDSQTTESQSLQAKHCVGFQTGVDNELGGAFLGGVRNSYNTVFAKVKESKEVLPNRTQVTDLTVLSYDSRGNIQEYVTRDGIHTVIVWSYNYQFPVLQIVGATYSSVQNEVRSLENRSYITSSDLRGVHQAVRAPERKVTGIVYDAWHGVSDIIAPNGKVLHYDKDEYGRLSAIRDHSSFGPVVQQFFYNYGH